jgi:hypothetical protein
MTFWSNFSVSSFLSSPQIEFRPFCREKFKGLWQKLKRNMGRPFLKTGLED